MGAYLIRRLLLTIPTLLLVTMIVFALVRFIPGDVVEMMAIEMAESGGQLTEEAVAEIRHRLGLDQPILIQYGRWLGVLPYPSENLSKEIRLRID